MKVKDGLLDSFDIDIETLPKGYKHEVNFACGLEYDREKEEILSTKFHIYLGEDTRKERETKYDCDRIGAVCKRK